MFYTNFIYFLPNFLFGSNKIANKTQKYIIYKIKVNFFIFVLNNSIILYKY